MITPAEGLAFLISAIIENLFSLIFFLIFSLKLTKVLFFSIKSFNVSIEKFFLEFSIFSIFFFYNLFEYIFRHFEFFLNVGLLYLIKYVFWRYYKLR